MFQKVLVANRGEIACRILRTLRRMNIASVAVASESDENALHARLADETVVVGPPPAADSYLARDRILEAARSTGAQALHPGYGFLSENADFAAACEARGVRFIGPTPEQIRRFGLKHLAREVALAQHVPLLPGTGLLADVQTAQREAARIGYPVMLKSTAGGGGIGLSICRDAGELDEAFEKVRRLAQQNFADGGAYLERYLPRARHIEVQIFGDGQGRVLALGERDCSTQRRNQKVIEEAPAPGLLPQVRAQLLQWAARMGQAVKYASAGTVEFVMDARTQEVYFLEVNTRLQVEHGVTEEITGVDLVEWMIRQAAGETFLPAVAPEPRGAACELRIYAEDPAKGFQPSTGKLTEVRLPPAELARVDGYIESGLEITPHYDPLLVKIIARGENREAVQERLRQALAVTEIHGIETNLAYLRALLDHPPFRSGDVATSMLGDFAFSSEAVEVIDGGTQSTVQDWPGRERLWAVGVPPSGPMDDLSFRLANRLVGNAAGAPALELTLTGPTLRFRREAVVALSGAQMPLRLQPGVGQAPQEMPWGRAFMVPAGGVLRLGAISGPGARAYLAVRGGFDVPASFGSRATFMLGGFGGHAGRALRTADVLRLGGSTPSSPPLFDGKAPTAPLAERTEIAVLYGPHGAPDFFTAGDMESFFGATFKVHYNSDRTGVRLIGPRPSWARKDGGEAGLHPSNIHDNAYAVGTVDFTGDMPILLGPDGPSLGGFVCPATVVKAERWKMGQLKAGDEVRFRRVTLDEAARLLAEQDALVEGLRPPPVRTPGPVPALGDDSPILDVFAGGSAHSPVVYRRDGDDYLLVEYGPLTLDVALRLRVHALQEALAARDLPGIIDVTPGIRSLQIHHDPRTLPTARLLAELRAAEEQLPAISELSIPSRVVHLPLSWEDAATLVAIEKYMRVVRSDAPWCPSNIEFIRRINGLPSVDDVRRIVFDASWLVLGLGDVYLGAPVATPVDPRHRLVTTKYNPARTWTPENAVGIGGAYLCIYGMEGPGGYQFVGRTVQVWNTHRNEPPFVAGKPWLLRFFDQIRFYPVDGPELLRMRAGFLHGRVPLKIEEGTFDFAAQARQLGQHGAEIAAFKTRQQSAFVAERERWAAAGQDLVPANAEDLQQPPPVDEALPPGCVALRSPVAGSLWRYLRQPGERIADGDTVAVVEAMKTEITVNASSTGVLRELRLRPGATVLPGQVLAVVDEAQ